MSIIEKVKSYFKEKRDHRAYEEAVAFLSSPDLFTPAQRQELGELFPKGWTHMDNFTQDEIFKLAVTMTLFGYGCDTPAKMKTALDVLVVQKIYRQDSGNPMVVKRC